MLTCSRSYICSHLFAFLFSVSVLHFQSKILEQKENKARYGLRLWRDGLAVHDETGVDRTRPTGLREDGGGFSGGWACLERTMIGARVAGFGWLQRCAPGFVGC